MVAPSLEGKNWPSWSPRDTVGPLSHNGACHWLPFSRHQALSVAPKQPQASWWEEPPR